MKAIGLECIAGQMNTFSHTVNEKSKFEFAYGLVEAVVEVINTNDDHKQELEQIYEIAARWERDLNMVIALELFLIVYHEISGWRNSAGIDIRMNLKLSRINYFNALIEMDLDLTFEKMLDKYKEKQLSDVNSDDIIDNPTAEQLNSIGE